MLQLFKDRWDGEPGAFPHFRLSLNMLRDLVISVPSEHFREPATALPPGVYRFTSNGARRFQRRSQHQSPRSMVCFLILGYSLGVLGDAPILPLTGIFVVLGYITSNALRASHERQDRWKNFEVILDGDRLLVTDDSGQQTFTRSEITRLQENPILLLIRTADERRRLLVPTLLTGYPELRASLSAWKPIEQAPYPRGLFFSVSRWLGVFGFAVLFSTALLVRSPYVFLPLSVIVGIFLIRSNRAVLKRRPQIPGQLRDPFFLKLLFPSLLALLLIKFGIMYAP